MAGRDIPDTPGNVAMQKDIKGRALLSMAIMGRVCARRGGRENECADIGPVPGAVPYGGVNYKLL